MICRSSTAGMSEHSDVTALAQDALGSTSRAEWAVRCLQGADRRGTKRRKYSAIWSVFEIGGRAAPVSAGCRRGAIQLVEHASQRAGPARLRPVVPASRVAARERAGERGDRRQGQAGPEGGTAVSHHRRCVSFAAMLIPGPVIASDNPPPDNRLRGRLPSLLPGVCGPAGYGRAVAGIGWPQRAAPR